MFLLDGPLVAKLSLFVYVMIELMAVVEQSVSEALSTRLATLLDVVSAFPLSRTVAADYSRLSNHIMAMWALDHREYKVRDIDS